jgi:hypothetical protein
MVEEVVKLKLSVCLSAAPAWLIASFPGEDKDLMLKHERLGKFAAIVMLGC